jgi:hypothetical protein
MPLHQNITDDFSLGVREAEISPSMLAEVFLGQLATAGSVTIKTADYVGRLAVWKKDQTLEPIFGAD